MKNATSLWHTQSFGVKAYFKSNICVQLGERFFLASKEHNEVDLIVKFAQRSLMIYNNFKH